MKALLLYLIRAFEFELAVEPEDIIRKELCVTTIPDYLAALTRFWQHRQQTVGQARG
jgi:hypothetical protein